MGDKTFQLLEKMYSELLEFKQETNDEFVKIDSRFDRIESHLLRIENNHGEKLDALFDGYEQNSDAIEEINEKLDKLTDRVENQEIKLQVLKSVKW